MPTEVLYGGVCVVLIKGSHRVRLCHSQPLQINHFRAIPLSMLCSAQLPRAWSRAADGGIPSQSMGQSHQFPKDVILQDHRQQFIEIHSRTELLQISSMSKSCCWSSERRFLKILEFGRPQEITFSAVFLKNYKSIHDAHQRATLNRKRMPLFSPLQLLRNLHVMVRRSDTLHQFPCAEAQQILDPLNSFTAVMQLPQHCGKPAS
ncbi:hypothetical protein E2320_015603 [Naja naja]|nr:hypothetical protein E2320_015603 [Naja naja]